MGGTGSGRKVESINRIVKEHIQLALDEDPQALTEIWKQVLSNAKLGSERHINILFGYYYGKPKENLEEPTEITVRVVREKYNPIAKSVETLEE